jgi:hypothetical protein
VLLTYRLKALHNEHNEHHSNHNCTVVLCGIIEMTHYHEGQEVEVLKPPSRDESIEHPIPTTRWRKAKIIQRMIVHLGIAEYEVEFLDGTRAVFDTDQIKEIAP